MRFVSLYRWGTKPLKAQFDRSFDRSEERQVVGYLPRQYIWLLALLLTLATVSYLRQVLHAQDAQTENQPAGETLPGTTLPGYTIPIDITPPGLAAWPKGQLTVFHAAPFNSTLANTALDICTENGQLLVALSNLTYLQKVSVVLPAAYYDWKVSTAGANCSDTRIDIAPFRITLQDQKLIVLTGDGVNQPLVTSINQLVSPGGMIHLPFGFR